MVLLGMVRHGLIVYPNVVFDSYNKFFDYCAESFDTQIIKSVIGTIREEFTHVAVCSKKYFRDIELRQDCLYIFRNSNNASYG